MHVQTSAFLYILQELARNLPSVTPALVTLSQQFCDMFILQRNLIYEHCLSQSASSFCKNKLSNQRFGQI